MSHENYINFWIAKKMSSLIAKSCVFLIHNIYVYLFLLCCLEVWQWIENMRGQVCDLERKVRLAKINVETISHTMAGWSVSPLFKRKDDKKECLLGLEVYKVW